MAKPHPQPKQPNNPRRVTYSSQTRELADEGRVLAGVLWRKVMAHAAPETREMLLTWAALTHAHRDIRPEQQDPPFRWQHDYLRKHVQKADDLLTGAAPRSYDSGR